MSKRVLLLGSPNVGKSTLFNRLTGYRLSIVHHSPETTRDWYEEKVADDLRFSIIDTEGVRLNRIYNGKIERNTCYRVLQFLIEIDLILLIFDGERDITIEDKKLSQIVRLYKKPTLSVLNKCDENLSPSCMKILTKVCRFGNESVAISAKYGKGLDKLYDWLSKNVSIHEEFSKVSLQKACYPSRIVVAGRTNVGKSTLVNTLTFKDRVAVSCYPETTRDAICVTSTHFDQRIIVVDTAGINPRKLAVEGIESTSIKSSFEAINQAEAVIIVVDALNPLNKLDLSLISMVTRKGKILVIALNKWDLVDKEMRKVLLTSIKNRARRSCSQIPEVPILPISALRSENVDKLIETVFYLKTIWSKKLNTSHLREWLSNLRNSKLIIPSKLTGIYLNRIIQIKTSPPTFRIFTRSKASSLRKIPKSYLRFLEKELRKEFNLHSVPLRLKVK